MLTEYIHAAMHHATYKQLGDGTYYGEIPGLDGLYANAPSLEACHDELRSALEDWMLFGLANGFSIPPIDGIALNPTKIA